MITPMWLSGLRGRRPAAPALHLLLALGLSLATALGDTVSWVGGGGNNSWDNPANWRTGAMPGPADDAVIDGAEPLTVLFESGSVEVKSLQCEYGFSLLGGNLALTEGSSWVQGALRLAAGKLTVAGAGTTFSATGITTHEGADIEANTGAQISLSVLQKINGDAP
jgi:hypothetical protein